MKWSSQASAMVRVGKGRHRLRCAGNLVVSIRSLGYLLIWWLRSLLDREDQGQKAVMNTLNRGRSSEALSRRVARTEGHFRLRV